MQPQVAIISSGNKAGFPDEIVVESYWRNNCFVYQTNNQGAITLKTDGSRYRIVTFLPRKRGLRKIWDGLKIWCE
jgi:beta-lactamase superfamily II metal-dependent hydrolase